MKILCVCEGGNVRSAQLAFFLKNLGHDAVAVGVLWNSPETVAKMAAWADRIAVAEERLVAALPAEHHGKVTLNFVVGPDRWGIPLIGELVAAYVQGAKQEGFELAPRPGGLMLTGMG